MPKLLSRVHLKPAHYVFAGVLLIRLAVLWRLTGSAFLLPARGDMHFYNDWAQKIAAGQLTDHLAFYGLPGYAYLLAGLYKLCGYGPFLPELLQALLDAGTAVLIYKIAVSITPEAVGHRSQIAGFMAALAWAFYVPAQTYAAVLMPTVCVIFVFWFILWRIIKKRTAPGWPEAFSIGLLVGLTATAIATILFLIPLLLCAIAFKAPTKPHPHFRTLGYLLVLLGVAIGTSPCWLHNCFVARDPILLSAHSGINFWIGNNPDANGYPRFPPGLRAGQAAMLQDSIDVAESAAGHPLKRGEVSQYWSAKARDYIARHPWGWIRLLCLKLRNLWNAFQYDDLSVITILREQSVTFPGIYFGVVATFALPMMFVLWNRAPLCRWITAAILLHLLALLPVFTTERYRLAVVPGLLVFAALGLIFCFENLVAGKLRLVLAYGASLILAAVFVSWPETDPSLWALDAYNSGWQALESGDLALAETKLQLARAYVPANPETNFALGNLRLAQGNSAAASAFYLATLQLDKNHRGALNNLGVMALEDGKLDAAENWLRHAENVNAGNAKIHFLLAKTLFAKNEYESARDEIQVAIHLRPEQSEFQQLKEQIEVKRRY